MSVPRWAISEMFDLIEPLAEMDAEAGSRKTGAAIAKDADIADVGNRESVFDFVWARKTSSALSVAAGRRHAIVAEKITKRFI